MIYVNRMVDAGATVIFWVADYFSMLNGKMGGDLGISLFVFCDKIIQ